MIAQPILKNSISQLTKCCDFAHNRIMRMVRPYGCALSLRLIPGTRKQVPGRD